MRSYSPTFLNFYNNNEFISGVGGFEPITPQMRARVLTNAFPQTECVIGIDLILEELHGLHEAWLRQKPLRNHTLDLRQLFGRHQGHHARLDAFADVEIVALSTHTQNRSSLKQFYVVQTVQRRWPYSLLSAMRGPKGSG